MSSSLAQFLKSVRIFSHLTDEELDLLVPHFQLLNVNAKTRVIEENSHSDKFYIIRSGHFEVTKGARESFITVLYPRDYFGEASLFHDVRRTANVTATEESQLLLLPRERFQQYLLSYPLAANRILFQLLREVFLRLQETSEELQGAREGELSTSNALHKILK